METIKKIWAIIKNENWEILIFKEKLNWGKNGFNIVKWTFDEFKDRTLLNWLKREIFEETNIENFLLEDIFGIFPKIYDNKNSLLVVFVVYVDSKKEIISNKNIQNDEEIMNYTWISKWKFKKLQKSDFVDERIFNVLRKYYDL